MRQVPGMWNLKIEKEPKMRSRFFLGVLLALYMITGWIVAGLVLAAFIKPGDRDRGQAYR